MEYLVKKSKYIYTILGVVALIGIAFPLLSIHINLLGTTTLDLSIPNLIQNIGRTSDNVISGGMAQAVQGDQLTSELGIRIIFPFGAYILSILLIIPSLVLIWMNKSKIMSKILLGAAAAICIYAGFALTSLPSILSNALEGVFESDAGGLGSLASMFDLTNFIEGNLGAGYWLTLIAIAILLVVKVIFDKYEVRIEKAAKLIND